jgi:hypothetical protein
MLLKGELELPSDLSGLVYELYQESPRECVLQISQFVESLRVPSVVPSKSIQ